MKLGERKKLIDRIENLKEKAEKARIGSIFFDTSVYRRIFLARPRWLVGCHNLGGLVRKLHCDG